MRWKTYYDKNLKRPYTLLIGFSHDIRAFLLSLFLSFSALFQLTGWVTVEIADTKMQRREMLNKRKIKRKRIIVRVCVLWKRDARDAYRRQT